MSAAVGVTFAAQGEQAGGHTAGNRFLLCAIAFHRSKQLKEGAAPRLAVDSHKPTHLAVLEVMADTVSWSRA